MLFYDWAKSMATNGDSNWSLRGYHIEALIVAPLIVLVLIVVSAIYDPQALQAAATAVTVLSPLWIPLFLFGSLWVQWMKFIRTRFWFSLDNVLLEITLPPEVEKSPLAMEVVLTSLWNSVGESTFIHRIIKGSYRPVWSLEIASNEGRVSFYIHMRRAWKNIIESRLYGQFPEAKITEVEDYASKIPFNREEYDFWGIEYDKAKPGAVPIKTYYDYELNKDPDTPEKIIDPITHILELFSSIGKDEYMWLQFILKARKKDEWYGFYTKSDKFKEGGKKVMQEMIEVAAKRSQKLLKSMNIADPEGIALKQAASRGGALLTEQERAKVEAIEKSMGKLIFEVGIRSMYIAKKERFNPINNGGLVRLFDTYRSPDLNQINLTRGLSIFDYPWQDIRNFRKEKIKRLLLSHYRNRAYFYVPYDQVPNFFNIEEMASLWHFPSSAVQAPGLERVASKRAEAPAGLPTSL